MDRAGLKSGGIHQYLPDQLVVALPHADRVLYELDELGARPVQTDSDGQLDLALVELGATGVAVARLTELDRVPDDDQSRTLRRQVEQERGTPAPELDLLLRGLRERFRLAYDDWVPTIGKNRVVRQVTGEYVIGGGDQGRPRPPGEYVIGGRGERPPEPPESGWPFEFPRRGTGQAGGADAGRGVRVGILDTKLAAHPWLAGTYVAGPGAMWLDPSEEAKRRWPQGHATFVAGLIVWEAPAVQLDVRPGLTREDATADTWNVAKELVRFTGSGVHVLNLSFGCFTEDGAAPLVLARAIDKLDAEVVVVAAAGNHGAGQAGKVRPRAPIWPAALDDVVAVGATDGPTNHHRDPARFSPDAPWVDLMAPGADITSTYLTGDVDGDGDPFPTYFPGYAQWSGTSFATAIVSGAIARATEPGRRSAREALDGLLRPPQPLAGNGKPFVLRRT